MTTTAYAPASGAKLWTARLNATRVGQTAGIDAVLAGDHVVVLGRDADNIAADEDVYDGVMSAYRV